MIPLDVGLGPQSASNFYSGFDGDYPLGLFVATRRPLPVGTLVALRVQLPSGARFEMTGRVAWMMSGRAFGMGIAFERLDGDAIRAVSQYTSAREPLFYA